MGWKPNLLGLIKQNCIFNFSTFMSNNPRLKKETPFWKVCSPQPFIFWEFVFAINKFRIDFPLKDRMHLGSVSFLSTVEVPSSYATFRKSYLVLDTLWLWFIAIINSCWSVNGCVTFNFEFLSIKRLCGNIYYNGIQHVSLYINDSKDYLGML